MKKTQEARSPVYFYKENIRINEDPLYKRGDRLGISDKKNGNQAIPILCPGNSCPLLSRIVALFK